MFIVSAVLIPEPTPVKKSQSFKFILTKAEFYRMGKGSRLEDAFLNIIPGMMLIRHSLVYRS